jgi:hypothetical protein
VESGYLAGGASPCDAWGMFHLELRQFPHVARAFNWTREELDARILRPWVQGRPVRWDDRSWPPDKAKLSIYEGPELPVEALGMGRGWGNVTKNGEDATGRLLEEARAAAKSPPALDGLKQAIVERSARAPVGFEELLALAAELAADADANQRLELAVRAMWELLREGRVRLSGAGEP